MKSKILVCMPTYHSPIEWIERAVNSLLIQTHEDFECFIVKDGCKKDDLNCGICQQTKKFCKNIQDKRFNFFMLPAHCGGAGWGPRNFAVDNSKNELIAYLDDDNWYEPNHLESLYRLFKDPDLELAYTGTRLYDSNLNILGCRVHPFAPKQGYIDTSEMMHKRYLVEKYAKWRFVTKGNDWDVVSRWPSNLKWNHTGIVTLNFYIREGCGTHRE